MPLTRKLAYVAVAVAPLTVPSAAVADAPPGFFGMSPQGALYPSAF